MDSTTIELQLVFTKWWQCCLGNRCTCIYSYPLIVNGFLVQSEGVYLYIILVQHVQGQKAGHVGCRRVLPVSLHNKAKYRLRSVPAGCVCVVVMGFTAHTHSTGHIAPNMQESYETHVGMKMQRELLIDPF